MIKAEVFRNEKAGSTRVVFESRDTSPEGLEKLDELFSTLNSQAPRRGAYLDSNKFAIEVKDET